ncbi:VWA domain-containing protein, partial [Halovivax cerinus]
TIGAAEMVGDMFSGSTIAVTAEDRNGNVERVVAYERTNLMGQISEELRAQGLSHATVEYYMGVLSGLTSGAGEIYGFLLALYKKPIETIAAMTDIIDVITNFTEVIASLPAAIDAQQDQNNPHAPGSEFYQEYRIGWYEGYVGWFILEALVPGGAIVKAVKNTKRFQKIASKLDTGEINRAAKLAGRVKHTTKTQAKFARTQLSRGLHTSIGVTRDAGERVLSEIRTAGAQYRVATLLHRHDVDGDALNDLDPEAQSTVGPTIQRGGAKTAEAMTDGGVDDVWRVHNMDFDVDSEKLASNLVDHSDEIELEQLVDDLEVLSEAGVPGRNRIADDLLEAEASNIDGPAFEARVTIEKGVDNVKEVQKPNPYSRGDIDVVTTDGRVIEAKSGDYSGAVKGDEMYKKLENKIGQYQQYIEVEGGTLEVALKTEPHEDITDMVESNGGEVVTYP